MKLETRGIRCLDCTGLDLKTHPDRSKNGIGQCQNSKPVRFVVILMSRNCTEFDAAPAKVVEDRDTWAAKNVPMFWERKR